MSKEDIDRLSFLTELVKHWAPRDGWVRRKESTEYTGFLICRMDQDVILRAQRRKRRLVEVAELKLKTDGQFSSFLPILAMCSDLNLAICHLKYIETRLYFLFKVFTFGSLVTSASVPIWYASSLLLTLRSY